MKQELTLDQWKEQQIESIQNFAKYWRHLQHEEGKTDFPDKLEKGDWDEQLDFYQEEI